MPLANFNSLAEQVQKRRTKKNTRPNDTPQAAEKQLTNCFGLYIIACACDETFVILERMNWQLLECTQHVGTNQTQMMGMRHQLLHETWSMVFAFLSACILSLSI